ncbi:MAG: hypothetical protein R6V31_05490 [Halohasta sp.]
MEIAEHRLERRGRQIFERSACGLNTDGVFQRWKGVVPTFLKDIVASEATGLLNAFVVVVGSLGCFVMVAILRVSLYCPIKTNCNGMIDLVIISNTNPDAAVIFVNNFSIHD